MIRSTIARKAADVSDRPRRCVMQAVSFVGVGRPAQLEDVPRPAAGPGQVLIKIGGAGVCHSDLHVMEEDLGFRPPLKREASQLRGARSCGNLRVNAMSSEENKATVTVYNVMFNEC